MAAHSSLPLPPSLLLPSPPAPSCSSAPSPPLSSPCLSCPKCSNPVPPRPSPWIACAQCSTSWHWACVTRNVLDPIDILDKWYCPDCIKLFPNLKPTYKHPHRKSKRSTSRINYADSSIDPGSDPDRFIKLTSCKANIIDALTTEGTGAHRPFRRMSGAELTLDWLLSDEQAMMEPVVIEEPDALRTLGMRMPPADISISQIAKIVGPETPVEVIDVASQAELARWTLGQWAAYYEEPSRERVRNVISLEVSETPLGELIELPRIVREMDWCETVWPEKLRQPGTGTYPKVQKYCLMSVARCWTDWHVDFAGSSVFYHILRGRKTFYFIRPTIANLAKYEQWSGNSAIQESTWLGDEVNVVYKVALRAGQTMIIPTGWIHAVHTPVDSLVFGGNYLHSLNIPIQLRIHQIENNTRVPKKFRFPFFIPMLWFVAHHYLNRLEPVAGDAAEAKQSAAGVATVSKGTTNLDSAAPIPTRVLSGLLTLSDFLVGQCSLSDTHQAQSSAERVATLAAHLHSDQMPNLRQTALTFQRLVRAALVSVEQAPTPSVATQAPGKGLMTLKLRIKRKAPTTEPSPSPKLSKAKKLDVPSKSVPKPSSVSSNPVPQNGKKDPGEIVMRFNEAPETMVSIQTRKIPCVDNKPVAKRNGGEDENEQGENERLVEGVEVRTTRAQNQVVRKWWDEVSGRMVYETRTVETVIEKAYFPQLS